MNENSLKEIVRKCYLKYLNREPDSAGLEHYVYLMKTKQIDEKILQNMFVNSPEYKINQLTFSYKQIPKIKIEKNGKTFFVNSSNNASFWASMQVGVWEPETFKIFDIFLDKNHSYIDLGAWIGPTVLYGCQNAKFCYAIEPDPVAFEYLKNNINLNDHLRSCIKLSDECITDFSGTTFLTPVSKEGGDSLSSIVFKKSPTSWKVKGITFHQFILDNSVRDCNFIKIDIEGGEFTVLPTMQEFLEKEKPTIYLSLHPPLIKNPYDSLKKIYKIISKYNFVYDNKLKALEKEFILRADNNDKFFDVIVTDKII